MESWPELDWTCDHWILFRRSDWLSYQAMSSTRTQSQLCTAIPISLFVHCHVSFRPLLSSLATFVLTKICLRQWHERSRMNDTYGIHHCRIIWSSYRKLAWVGFESTTYEFRSDALTDWAIRPWFQLALRANCVQLLQFNRLFSATFHFGYCPHQSPCLFNWE